MPVYRLHHFPESGNSYKLALMLSLCGQAFEPVWTDFAAGVTRTLPVEHEHCIYGLVVRTFSAPNCSTSLVNTAQRLIR